MNTQAAPRMIRVWDPVVRIFHWTLVAGFIANMGLVDDGSQAHKIIGYTLLGAIGLRLIWGFVGTRHARFSDFVPGPRRLLDYLGQLLRGREPRHVGHNPAAAMMMLALIGLMILVGISGWMMTLDRYWGEEWLEEVHEVLANSILVLMVIHVLAALFSSFKHHENLILAMITGRKRAASATDVDHAAATDRR